MGRFVACVNVESIISIVYFIEVARSVHDDVVHVHDDDVHDDDVQYR